MLQAVMGVYRIKLVIFERIREFLQIPDDVRFAFWVYINSDYFAFVRAAASLFVSATKLQYFQAITLFCS